MLAGIIRQRAIVALLPRPSLSLRLFSCFLFSAKQAAAFYSFNDYSVFWRATPHISEHAD